MTFKHSLKRSIISLMILSPSLCFADTNDFLNSFIENLVKQQVNNQLDNFSSLLNNLNEKQSNCLSSLVSSEIKRVMQSSSSQINQFIESNPKDAKLVEEALNDPEYTKALYSTFDYSDVNELINTLDPSVFFSGDEGQIKNAEKEFELKLDEYSKNKVAPLEEATKNLSPSQQKAMDEFSNMILPAVMTFEFSDVKALDSCLTTETEQSDFLPAD